MHVHEGHGPPRVLLGNLEPVVTLGMTAVLEEDGIDVVGEESRPAALVLMAGHLRPDAVVLDLGQTTSRELSNRVRAASPETTVVFWARDEDVMEVVGPGTSEPRRVFTPVREELRSELMRSQVNRVER
jgi:AmiR/NasT family two-component response regulator